MCHFIESTFLCALILVVGLNLYGLVHYQRFLTYLERTHHAHWVNLGRPALSDDPPSFSPFGFTSYFYGRHYQVLGDAEAVRIGDAARRWWKICLSSALGLLLAFAVVQSLGTPWISGACWFI